MKETNSSELIDYLNPGGSSWCFYNLHMYTEIKTGFKKEPEKCIFVVYNPKCVIFILFLVILGCLTVTNNV